MIELGKYVFSGMRITSYLQAEEPVGKGKHEAIEKDGAMTSRHRMA